MAKSEKVATLLQDDGDKLTSTATEYEQADAASALELRVLGRR